MSFFFFCFEGENSSFDEEGLITGVAKTNEIRIGKYILDEIDISNTTHHIEYFGGE
jgi:hypothetical protein